MQLDRALALDRLASGHGALTLHWSLASDPAFDLLAYADDTSLEVRGDDIVIDLLPGVHRVLVATGTRGQAQLPDSMLTVSNGATVVECRLPGGTSLGVWPRISLVGVDEFIVVLDERDPRSGGYEQVAKAYDHDPLTFVRAGRG